MVKDANAKARREAVAAGRQLYGYQVFDTWPACVECDTPIRNIEDPRPGPWRACQCPNVRWRLGTDSWVKDVAPWMSGGM